MKNYLEGNSHTYTANNSIQFIWKFFYFLVDVVWLVYYIIKYKYNLYIVFWLNQYFYIKINIPIHWNRKNIRSCKNIDQQVTRKMY